jgi:hypothetical protein
LENSKIPGMFQFPPLFYCLYALLKKSMLHDPYLHDFLRQYFCILSPWQGGERGAYLDNSQSICCPQLRAFRTQFPLISGPN